MEVSSQVLLAERQRKIVELVNDRLSVRVSELSAIFSVTEETIRRDLEKLEKEEKLLRSHGGAVNIKQGQTESSFEEREIQNISEKKEIALEAINYIEPGEQILLDASTTAWYLAKELPDMPLTVITNSINVVIELSKKEKVKVISTGGLLLSRSLSYVGPLAERSLKNYHVNKAFISCKGIHLETGLSDMIESQALLKKQMMSISDQIFLMADSSKFGVRSFARINELDQVSHVITDSSINSSFIDVISSMNIGLTLVK